MTVLARLSLLIACLLATSPSPAAGAQPASGELFSSAVENLEQGAYQEAIDQLELLSDRGFVHPDASFNRAVAYAMRARSSSAEPGDLGRTAAGLSETLQLRPSDEQAEHALAQVQSAISRERVRRGADPVVARPTITRTLSQLLPENGWAILAAFGSCLLTIGLVLRLWARATSYRLTGAIAVGIGIAAFVCFTTLALIARHFRLTTTPAVVVAEQAHLLDERGAPAPASGDLEQTIIPEGAQVYVHEQRGALGLIEWGMLRGWVHLNQIRKLSTATSSTLRE